MAQVVHDIDELIDYFQENADFIRQYSRMSRNGAEELGVEVTLYTADAAVYEDVIRKLKRMKANQLIKRTVIGGR